MDGAERTLSLTEAARRIAAALGRRGFDGVRVQISNGTFEGMSALDLRNVPTKKGDSNVRRVTEDSVSAYLQELAGRSTSGASAESPPTPEPDSRDEHRLGETVRSLQAQVRRLEEVYESSRRQKVSALRTAGRLLTRLAGPR
jgi:hypothetical protein